MVTLREFRVPDECRLECTSALQRQELDAFLIIGVSIRNAVISDPSAPDTEDGTQKARRQGRMVIGN